MKITLPSKIRREQGVALLITILILMVGAATLASYLLLTENEYTAVNRSQLWNNSMTLTEAGIEEALAFMNKYDGSLGMVSQWSTPASAAQDGWTISNGVYFVMHRIVSTNTGYYDVVIDNTYSNAPVILCNGYAYSYSASRKLPFMLGSAGLTVSSPAIGRTVVVSNTYEALFPDAIDSRTNINLNGNNVRVDSFDSSSSTYSDWNSSLGYGTYDLNKAKANGNVATDSDLVGAISVGQANIYGKINTGPGGSATVGNNGYVGPLPQNGSGIQNGYSNDTMNITFPDVSLPAGASTWQTFSGSTISSPGNYYMSGISGNLDIEASNVTIYVNGSISLSGQQYIKIGTNATHITFYVAGPSISTSGQATMNNLTQHAVNLAIYGLPSLTSIQFGGNAAYTGTMYAPEASFGFGGGGNNTYDFVGAIVVNYVQLNGHANFHYDETLATQGPGRGYLPVSWKELGAN